MAEARRRRWLRFSLRALFLLTTAAALWLGREVSIVRERRAAFDDAKKLKAAFEVRGPSPHWLRSQLGDSEVDYFIISKIAHPPDLGEQLRRAFPEAAVIYFKDIGH